MYNSLQKMFQGSSGYFGSPSTKYWTKVINLDNPTETVDKTNRKSRFILQCYSWFYLVVNSNLHYWPKQRAGKEASTGTTWV